MPKFIPLASILSALLAASAITAHAQDFTIAVLPDTQFYSATMNGGTPSMFDAQAQWIADNKTAQSIKYVAHVGDVVEHGDTNDGTYNGPAEWNNAKHSMNIIDAAGIPYGVSVGNHDTTRFNGGPNPPNNSTTSGYNSKFGISQLGGKSWWGGTYQSSKANSHYDLFTAGGKNYIVIYLEYDDSTEAKNDGTYEQHDDAAITWAAGRVSAYSSRSAIIVSHYIATTDNPAQWGQQGQKIYNALKGYSNVVLFLSGHLNGGGRRQDPASGGTSSNMISTLVADYQTETNGGNGFMRLYKISNDNNSLTATTYSPVTGTYQTDSHNAFQIQLRWNSREDIFYRNSGDSALAQIHWNGSAWIGPTSLGGTLSSSPAAVSRGANLVDVFYEGSNGHLTWRSWNGSAWSAEQDMGVVISGAPAVAARGLNRMDLFYKGSGNTLEWMQWNGTTWTAKPSLGGTLTSDPAATSWDPDKIDVAYRGADGACKHRAWNGTDWLAEESLGGQIVGAPALSSRYSGELDVYVQGTDGSPYHRYYNSSGWDSGFVQQMGAMGSTGASASWGHSHSSYVFRGTGTQLWELVWDSASGWSQQALGGTPIGAPAIASWSHIF